MVFLLRTEIVTAESLEILQNYKIASNLVLQTGSLISHSLLFLILTKDDISSSIQYKFYFLATAAFLVFAAILQAAIPTMSHSLTSFAWVSIL